VDYINNCWQFISKYCLPNYCLPKEEFIKAVQFVLNSTFLIFDNVICKQNYDTSMSSPLFSLTSESWKVKP